jgi:hypothetical protein
VLRWRSPPMDRVVSCKPRTTTDLDAHVTDLVCVINSGQIAVIGYTLRSFCYTLSRFRCLAMKAATALWHWVSKSGRGVALP